MSNETNKMLDDFVVNIEMTVREVNSLLNILNTPLQVPTTTFMAFINLLQQQAAPQVMKAEEGLKAALDAAKNADGVPKDLEEKN